MSIANIGRLCKKVSIVSGVAGEYGGFDTITDNLLYKNIWADIVPMKGRERFEPMKGRENYIANPIRNDEEVKIIVRYRADITEGCKVLYRQHVYEIKSIVDPDMEHESLELYCTEKKRGNTPTGTKLPAEEAEAETGRGVIKSEAWVP